MIGAEAQLAAGFELGREQLDRPVVHHPPLGMARFGPGIGVEQVDERQRPVGYPLEHPQRVAVKQTDVGQRGMQAAVAADMDQRLGDAVDERFGADEAVVGQHGRPLGNVRLHHGDALPVLERVPDGALSFLYLLHPDPWPKARHAKRRMMNDGPVGLFAAKLKPGGELRFGTDHPVYLRHALMTMRRHVDSFEWLVEGPQSWQHRPAGWIETRYETKARRLGHEIWYFRFRRR